MYVLYVCHPNEYIFTDEYMTHAAQKNSFEHRSGEMTTLHAGSLAYLLLATTK